MFDTDGFWFKIHYKPLEDAKPAEPEKRYEPGLVIFIQVEEVDETDLHRAIKKATDNISWLAKKTNRTHILLHSFVHLSESRSTVEVAEQIFDNLRDKLVHKGYTVIITPSGYFLEFKIHVRGESLAKVCNCYNHLRLNEIRYPVLYPRLSDKPLAVSEIVPRHNSS